MNFEPLPLGRKKPTTGWVTVARFSASRPAEDLLAVLTDAGILGELCGPDCEKDAAPWAEALSMDGDHSGRMVEVRIPPAQVASALAALEKDLALEPDDPLRSLSRQELLEITSAHSEAGLQERAAARVLLKEMGTTIDHAESQPSAKVQDAAADFDRRMGCWIAGLGCMLAVIVILTSISLTIQPPLFESLLLLTIGISLIYSTRRLPGGSKRPLFSRGFRIIGVVILTLTLSLWATWIAILIRAR